LVFAWLFRKQIDGDVKKQADLLLSAHSDDAVVVARKKAVQSKKKFDWKVVRYLEKQFEIEPRVDTTTRYLENEKERSSEL
jgi:hypothetical protein